MICATDTAYNLAIFYEAEEKKAVDGGYFNNIIYICKNYET